MLKSLLLEATPGDFEEFAVPQILDHEKLEGQKLTRNLQKVSTELHKDDRERTLGLRI